jgi:5-methylcytosine-specific restriction endonuclease McrA
MLDRDRKRYRADPAKYRARFQKWKADNPESARRSQVNADYRRRAREAGVEIDPLLDVFTVFEEQNYVCQICFEPCDPLLRNRHPRMVTIDHIVRLKAGGGHTRSNVQTAHYGCNAGKDNTHPARQKSRSAGLGQSHRASKSDICP